MGAILAGLAAGASVGALNHWLVRRARRGRTPTADALSGLGQLFFVRFAVIVAALLGFWFLTGSAAGTVALALSAVGLSRLLLLREVLLGSDCA